MLFCPLLSGKTETVKDLAKALGYPCIVTNCGEGLDYKAMGSIFSGLVQTGQPGGIGRAEAASLQAPCLCLFDAHICSCFVVFLCIRCTGSWGCFDEFNRIDVEVLSVVSSQLQTIQTALNLEKTRFEFLGKEINIRASVGYFITMNPGYAGRTGQH